MSSENSSDVKFEIGHVLFIDIVGYWMFFPELKRYNVS